MANSISSALVILYNNIIASSSINKDNCSTVKFSGSITAGDSQSITNPSAYPEDQFKTVPLTSIDNSIVAGELITASDVKSLLDSVLNLLSTYRLVHSQWYFRTNSLDAQLDQKSFYAVVDPEATVNTTNSIIEDNTLQEQWVNTSGNVSKVIGYDTSSISEGTIESAEEINRAISNFITNWKSNFSIVSSPLEYTYYTCHSNCHSNCHSSRGRR